MDTPIDRSRANALQSLKNSAAKSELHDLNLEGFLEKFVDIGFRNQFSDTDRSISRQELNQLIEEMTPFFGVKNLEN